MNIVPVQPIGKHESTAFVDGPKFHEIRTTLEDSYPRSARGESFRFLRLENEIGLRDAAIRLGIKASELSGLETGRYDLSESDWADAFAKIAKIQ